MDGITQDEYMDALEDLPDLSGLSVQTREAFTVHWVGGTSRAWLMDWLERAQAR